MNFQVELHNYCQLTCGYCVYRQMERKKEFMSDTVWHRILHDYILPYKDTNRFCTPTLIGHKDTEPLIGRNMFSRWKDVADHAPGMNIDIYSNGLLLPQWHDRGQDVFEFLGSIPNKVRYLMSFHPRNHDNSVNDYSKVIPYLQEVLCNRRPPNVEFITVSHRSKWVSENLQKWWESQWKDYPITVHCNASLNPWTGLIEEEGTIQFNGCPYGDFGHWFFGVTGNIIACCLDLEEEIVLGNVLEDDPAEMFAKTEAFYAEQRRILEAKELHPRGVCRNCFGQKRDDDQLVQLGTKA